MMSGSLRLPGRLAVAAALCATFFAVAPESAQARVFVGVGFGAPFYAPGYFAPPPFYPPPVYYAPPPMYYPSPPPVVYTPPLAYSHAPAAAGGQSCYAGSYVCPMDRPVAAGAGCYCLGNGGQRISGRAN